MNKRNAVVFGGTGFVGRWLIRELLANNYNVTVVARDKNKLPHDVQKIIKINEINELQDTFLLQDFYEYFFYVAWNGVDAFQKNDVNCQLENIKIAIEVLNLVKKAKIKKLVAVGTVAQYQLSDSVIDPLMRANPSDIYGAVKDCVYTILKTMTRKESIEFNWIILASTYGPERSENNIISYTITKLLKNERPVFGNLKQMWDFIYVEDAVHAIRYVAENGKNGEIYSVGSGEHRKLKEYIIEIAQIMGKKELGIGERDDLSRKSTSSCVDIRKLVDDTGYKSKYTFNEGIKKTIAYYEKSVGMHCDKGGDNE